MEYLKIENSALRKELTELVTLMKMANMAISSVLNDEKQDKDFIKEIHIELQSKLDKLKTLING